MPGQGADVTGGLPTDGRLETFPGGATMITNIKAYDGNVELELAGAGQEMGMIVQAETVCHILFAKATGSAADTNDMPIPAGFIPVYVGLVGQTHVNVIKRTDAGDLYVTEILGGTLT